MPDRAEVRGGMVMGDGRSRVRLSADHFVDGHYTVTAPLRVRFESTTYNADPFDLELTADVRERIAVLEDWVQGGFQPDMTILFDLPIDVGMQRAGQRGELDRFEQEDVSFFEGVRASYRERARRHPRRFRVVDASLELDAVRQQLDEILDELLAGTHVGH